MGESLWYGKVFDNSCYTIDNRLRLIWSYFVSKIAMSLMRTEWFQKGVPQMVRRSGYYEGFRCCQGQRPVNSRSRVKLRKVRMATTIASTPTVLNVNSTATV